MAVAEIMVMFEEEVGVMVEFEKERVVDEVGTVRVERVDVFGKDVMEAVVEVAVVEGTEVIAPKIEVAAPPRMEVMSETMSRSPRISVSDMVRVWLSMGMGMVRVWAKDVIV